MCHHEKPITSFGTAAESRDGRRDYCKMCRPPYDAGTAAWRCGPGQIKAMLASARDRAKKHGILFDLDHTDISIPDVCPVLGIPLVRNTGGARPNSPSLDRIVPTRGYTAENVQVLSQKANVMKNDATPDELRAFARWVRQTYGE